MYFGKPFLTENSLKWIFLAITQFKEYTRKFLDHGMPCNLYSSKNDHLVEFRLIFKSKITISVNFGIFKFLDLGLKLELQKRVSLKCQKWFLLENQPFL